MAADRPKSKPAGRLALLSVLLFFVVLGTFLPCLWNGFINLDDRGYVSQNPHVRQGLTWESVKWAWGNVAFQNWHPLTWISHMLDVQVFGLNPSGHHATNVVLHALNAALLFLLLQRITGARWRSLAVAALFGLHPLRVESVAWVSERKDVLSVLFGLLSIWAYACYAQRSGVTSQRSVGSRHQAKGHASRLTHHDSRLAFYVLSLALYAFGLLSKPMLVTLPFALLLLEYWPLRRWPGTPLKLLLLEKVPFLVLAAASSVVTYLVQQRGGAVTPVSDLSVSSRLGNALVSYTRYLGKTLWPVDLCIMYPHPGHWPAATVAAAAVFLAAVTALVLWKGRSMPYLAVGWLWFLGTLLPVIGLVQVGLQSMADRYTYLPSIGLWLAVVWALADLLGKLRHGQVLAWASAVTAILICMVLTLRQVGYWKNSSTLFDHAMKVTSRNWAVAAFLANELQSEGNLEEAIAYCEQSLAINPHHPEVRCKLADMLMERRRFDEALAQYQQAAAQDPSDIYAQERVGGALQDLGRLDEAIEQFNRVIRLNPGYADAYSNLGNCYGLKGRADEAIACFEQAVKLKPHLAQNHRELGVGLANRGRWDEAIAQFRQTLQLDPADAIARRNLEAALLDQAKAQRPVSP